MTKMHTWSPQQAAALAAVSAWLKSGSEPCFYLAGYAGSGKTSLAKHFAEEVSNVVYAAFTGKAASVMRSKGCREATTIHRLIYESSHKSSRKLKELQKKLETAPEGERGAIRIKIAAEIRELKQPAFKLNREADVRNASLIIIDECSMVGEQMGKDLLSFKVPVLVLGDPAQLPPVFGTGFFTSRTPDVMLTEVHRQAQESGILQLATKARRGAALPYGDYGNARVVKHGTMDPQEIIEFDQVLVGTNKSRHGTNLRIRQLRGMESAFPLDGDRLVCLRNNHDLGLLNGEIYSCVGNSRCFDDELVTMSVESCGSAQSVDAWQAPFTQVKSDRFSHDKDVQEFTYGYALTVHKSQGSEWDRVVVFDESRFFRANAQKHLYTAITRAAKELVIVR